ncbi:MAG: hypothetical protein HQL05_15535 [Nitrospirae bacterium]|uniref:hypothetical protein n=1 Tax=Candidatus Magnetobacterium casense TaxID=1455061 RepID=UPI0005912A7B|nr:hypothetical protein [Candidatus Magnetobacterium casensis]MBF0339230.1 hypothetical protein [Nitrospirota bacterium]
MQMILEARVDRLENLMAEVIELHRDLVQTNETFRQEMKAIKLDAAEREQKFEEWLKKDKEEREFVADNTIAYATRKGLHVVAYREWEYLDILNFDEINEKNQYNDTPLTLKTQ